MTDSTIETMLAYYRVSRGGSADMIADHAAADVRALSMEIDAQRQLNNQLADQSQRLRAIVETQRKVLEKVKSYCEASTAHIKEKHASFVVGTIVGMVNQGLSPEIA